MTRRCCHSIALLAAALALGAPGRALAAGSWQEELERDAREHFTRGLRLFSTQRYDEAIEEFRAAYLGDPHPKILYTLGQTYRLGGDCPRAIDAYSAFLRAGPVPEFAKLARENLEACRARAKSPARPSESLPSEAHPAEPPKGEALPSEPKASTSAEPPRERHLPEINSHFAMLEPLPSALPETSSPPAVRALWYTDALGDALLAGGLLSLSTAGAALVVERQETTARAATCADHERHDANASLARRVEIGAASAGMALAAAAILRYAVWPSTARAKPALASSGSRLRVTCGLGALVVALEPG
jgi:tetratricopeptide (TPR) repeat protein